MPIEANRWACTHHPTMTATRTASDKTMRTRADRTVGHSRRAHPRVATLPIISPGPSAYARLPYIKGSSKLAR